MRRRAKVDSVRLAHALDCLVVARQPEYLRVKLSQVLFQHLRRVARGVAGDHYGRECLTALRDRLVVHQRHLVELVRANVGAVAEAKVDLRMLR
jgi:hypothetical protein